MPKLDEQGNPIIPEDLRNKPRTEWTLEDYERSGGSGRAPEMVVAALSLTPAGRAIVGSANTAKTAIDLGKKVWQSPQMKSVRTSDFIQNLRSGGDASKMQRTIDPIKSNSIVDEVMAIEPKMLNMLKRINSQSGFKAKDLPNTFTNLQEIFSEQASINFEDKGGFLNVENWYLPKGYREPRQSTISKVGGNLFKRLSEREKYSITEIITNLEDYHQIQLEKYQNNAASGWQPQKPTRGFSGTRTLTTKDGKELGVGWNNKQQSYFLFDFKKNKASLKSRYKAEKSGDDPWSKLTAKVRKSSIKIKNEKALEALERIRTENPDLYFDIVGSMSDPDNVWTAEHINSRTSGVWIKQPDGRLIHKFKQKADGSALYFGDSENIIPATGSNYGTLKTNIENHLASLPDTDIHSGLYIDIDPKSRNFLLRNRSNGKIAEFKPGQPYARIHGMTPSNKWSEVLENVLAGNPAIGLVDTNPIIPTDLALEQPGILGKESNTRLEPISGNIEISQEEIAKQELDAKIDSLPLGLSQRIRNIKELLDAHESGEEVLSQSRYKRLSKEYSKTMLQMNLFE